MGIQGVFIVVVVDDAIALEKNHLMLQSTCHFILSNVTNRAPSFIFIVGCVDLNNMVQETVHQRSQLLDLGPTPAREPLTPGHV